LVLLGRGVQQGGHRLAHLAFEQILVGQPELSAVLVLEIFEELRGRRAESR